MNDGTPHVTSQFSKDPFSIKESFESSQIDPSNLKEEKIQSCFQNSQSALLSEIPSRSIIGKESFEVEEEFSFDEEPFDKISQNETIEILNESFENLEESQVNFQKNQIKTHVLQKTEVIEDSTVQIEESTVQIEESTVQIEESTVQIEESTVQIEENKTSNDTKLFEDSKIFSSEFKDQVFSTLNFVPKDRFEESFYLYFLKQQTSPSDSRDKVYQEFEKNIGNHFSKIGPSGELLELTEEDKKKLIQSLRTYFDLNRNRFPSTTVNKVEVKPHPSHSVYLDEKTRIATEDPYVAVPVKAYKKTFSDEKNDNAILIINFLFNGLFNPFFAKQLENRIEREQIEKFENLQKRIIDSVIKSEILKADMLRRLVNSEEIKFAVNKLLLLASNFNIEIDSIVKKTNQNGQIEFNKIPIRLPAAKMMSLKSRA